VQLWDVVNEAIEGDGTRRKSIWELIIGPEYIEQAFRWAHEADPAAVLLYNDFNNEGLNPKSDAIYELLRDLKSRGVPVHGIGMQAHLVVGKIPKRDAFLKNLRRLADLGMELHITEADIRVLMPPAPEALEKQAQDYRDLLEAFLELPQARSFTMWGFTDRHSWVPRFHQGFGIALPWDENNEPKPARAALIEALRGKP
jgi:endo-1,4-beta-xylanase